LIKLKEFALDWGKALGIIATFFLVIGLGIGISKIIKPPLSEAKSLELKELILRANHEELDNQLVLLPEKGMVERSYDKSKYGFQGEYLSTKQKNMVDNLGYMFVTAGIYLDEQNEKYRYFSKTDSFEKLEDANLNYHTYPSFKIGDNERVTSYSINKTKGTMFVSVEVGDCAAFYTLTLIAFTEGDDGYVNQQCKTYNDFINAENVYFYEYENVSSLVTYEYFDIDRFI
ncbi:MAG: hypothetical protein ACI4U5_02860, partial [Bacilli bacterium]